MKTLVLCSAAASVLLGLVGLLLWAIRVENDSALAFQLVLVVVPLLALALWAASGGDG